MKAHLVDGTYELFRAYFGAPSAHAPDGREVGAVRGFMTSLAALIRNEGITHLACAFDTTVESFRNSMFAGYKTGEGIEEDLLGQFPLVERGAAALGAAVWGMVEFEADDALATGAALLADQVDQVVLCSPDKDLAQCVRGDRVVTLDRMRKRTYAELDVVEKFGVAPASIPDYLALVGDAADGIPGVPRWGAKSTALVLSHYRSLESIPLEGEWEVAVRGAKGLATQLRDHYEEAQLYKKLATLRTDVPLVATLEALSWEGPRADALESLGAEIGWEDAPRRFAQLRPSVS